jgi:hypothetical protein
VIRHERSRHQAHRRASSDVDGNRVARMIGGEQSCCDEGCRPAGDHRGKLKSQRGTAVTQSWRESLDLDLSAPSGVILTLRILAARSASLVLASAGSGGERNSATSSRPRRARASWP